MKMDYKEPEMKILKYSLPVSNLITTSLDGGTDHGNPWLQPNDTYSANNIFAE